MNKRELVKRLKRGVCLGLAGAVLATSSPVVFGGVESKVEARPATDTERHNLLQEGLYKDADAYIKEIEDFHGKYSSMKYSYFGGYTDDFNKAVLDFHLAISGVKGDSMYFIGYMDRAINKFNTSSDAAVKLLDDTLKSSINNKISKYKGKDDNKYKELMSINNRRKEYVSKMNDIIIRCRASLAVTKAAFDKIKNEQESLKTAVKIRFTRNSEQWIKKVKVTYTKEGVTQVDHYDDVGGNSTCQAITYKADRGSQVIISDIELLDGSVIAEQIVKTVDGENLEIALGDLEICNSKITQVPIQTQAPVVTVAPTVAPIVTQLPVAAQQPTVAPIVTQKPTVAPVVTQQPTVAPVFTQPPVVTPAIKQCIVDFSIIQGEDKSVKIKSGEIEYVKNGINFSKELKDTTGCQLLADDGTLLNVCDVVLTNGVKVDKKVFRVSGDTTCKLDISAFATLAPTVVPTQAPVYTEQPVVTTQPVVTVVPTQAPVVTQQPVYTTQPVYTQNPVYTQAPVYTQNPGSVTSPTYTEKPVVTQQPVQTQAPVDTAQPVVTQQPVQTQAPVVPTIKPTVDPDENDFSEDNKMEVDPDGSIPEASEDPEASLVCDKKNFKVGVGERFKLPVKGIGVKFKGDSYCTVDRYGYVKAKKVGTSKVVITDGVSKINVTVIVKKAPSKVKFKAKAFKLKAGYIYKLQPILNNNCASYKNKWKSSNKKIFTVSNGKIKALRKGKATITVTTYNGKSARAKIVVEK